jgi:hypothetical protein
MDFSAYAYFNAISKYSEYFSMYNISMHDNELCIALLISKKINIQDIYDKISCIFDMEYSTITIMSQYEYNIYMEDVLNEENYNDDIVKESGNLILELSCSSCEIDSFLKVE